MDTKQKICFSRVTPRNHFVCLADLPKQDVTDGGIVLPEGYNQEVNDIGIVNSVGVDVRGDIIPGDKVFYYKHGRNKVAVKGETYILVRDEDIMAKIND